MNKQSKLLQEKIESIMERSFGTTLENGSPRQVYEALLVATNDVLAKKRYDFQKKV